MPRTLSTAPCNLYPPLARHYTSKPHTLSTVTDRGTQTSYLWDANGNMIEVNNGSKPKRVYYSLEWDEENRLRLADMPKALQCAYYQYDASGERFYKNVGVRDEMINNGHTTLLRRSYLFSTKQLISTT